MAVSLSEVAKRANVSRNTVSSVLNNKVEARIAKATQERVRRIAEELGYQPNRFARSLSMRKTEMIKLFISELRNPFFVNVLEKTETLAADRGYHVIVETEPETTGDVIPKSKLAGWPVDGILMWENGPQQLAACGSAEAQNIPIVYLGNNAPPADFQNVIHNWIEIDLNVGARQAAKHIVESGYTRIAQLVVANDDGASTFDQRHRAYSDEVRKSGLELEVINCARNRNFQISGYKAGQELLLRDRSLLPDAVFCHNDMMAIGLYNSLRRGGLKIPDEVAIVGFDGLVEGLYMEKSLSTISIPMDEILNYAVDLLLTSIEAKSPVEATHRTFATSFVKGETS